MNRTRRGADRFGDARRGWDADRRTRLEAVTVHSLELNADEPVTVGM